MNNGTTLTAPDECKVFTPAALAHAMARVLSDRPGCRWLEPCVGRGVFVDALTTRGVGADRITAIELDHHVLPVECPDYRFGVDFLGWSLDTQKRYDRVIGNPPYLKLHRAHSEVISAALRIPRPGGGTVPLRANCWYAFVCASLRLLRPAGGLCFVLPAGWDYANYAADLRERLPQMFARFEIVRGAKSFFDGILDGCVILIADGYGEPNTVLRRHEFGTLAQVIDHLGSARDSGARRIEHTRPPDPAPRESDRKRVTLGQIARVRIGAVTGDARYFLMTEEQRTSLGLCERDVRPVLTRARHLEGAAVTAAHWQALRDRGERVWLFWPAPRPGRRPRAVKEYLESGLARESHVGQKTREREHWFLTVINPHADAFLSGMTSVGPWLCLNRARNLTATNTLYTVHFHKRLRWWEQAAWALSLLSSEVAEQHAVGGRSYSKGLLKFEPQDVMDLMLPAPVDSSERAIDVYKQAVDVLLAGEVARARELASAFVTKGRCH